MEQAEKKEREEATVEYKRIPVDSVSQGEHGLRRVASEKGMEELRLSIARYGVLVPIVVTEKETGYDLVCGRRRVLCAQALAMAEIPALVVKASEEWQSWACLTENRVREQVNPVDEGVWMQQEMVKQGINQRALAERLQVSEQYVGQRLSTMRWPDDVREAVLEGVISFAVGRELWQITEEMHRRHLLRVAAVSGCTARQAADWRRAWLREQAESLPELSGEAEPDAAAEPGVAAGRCVMCQADLQEGEGCEVRVCETCKNAVGLAATG